MLLDCSYAGSRKFESQKTNFAGYVSNEVKLFGVLRTVMGLRTELFDMYYTGKNTAGTETYNSENVIKPLTIIKSCPKLKPLKITSSYLDIK